MEQLQAPQYTQKWESLEVGGAEGIFEGIMDKASPNLMKTINSETREAQQTQET